MSDESNRVVASALLPVTAGCVLAIAKAAGHLDWPWFWITCPIWGVGLYLVLCVLGGLVAAMFEDRRGRRS